VADVQKMHIYPDGNIHVIYYLNLLPAAFYNSE